jgi:phospholipase/carboxylesterase
MSEPILIHKPLGAASQLMLLFHGVGSTPQNMVPIGRRLAA